MWDLWQAKWHWGRCLPSTLVSPANIHSTNSTINRPVVAAVLNGLNLTPPLIIILIIIQLNLIIIIIIIKK
jgi:hypothetical protein